MVCFRKRSNTEISYPILTKLGNQVDINVLNADEHSKKGNKITLDDQTETNKQQIEQSGTSSISVICSKGVNSFKITNSWHLFLVKEENIDIISQRTESETMGQQRNLNFFNKQGSLVGSVSEDTTELTNKLLNICFKYDMDHNKNFNSDSDDRKNEYIPEQQISEVNNNSTEVVIDISDENKQERKDHFKNKPDREPV